MPSLFQSLLKRSAPAISLDQWAEMFSFNGLTYQAQTPTQTLGGKGEPIDGNFAGYVHGAYRNNGVVFACMLARMLLFSEARFQFRRVTNGRPGDLFGTQALSPLEQPWTNGTTGDLLARAIQDVDLAGNFYGVRRGETIRRLRPDWVTIILGSQSGSEIDVEVAGYSYKPGGPASGEDPILLLPEQVAHFAPIPDPLARFRGMSWLTPVLREITADRAATAHKEQFYENGATVNMVVTIDVSDPTKFQEWIDKFEQQHVGLENAYKTLYLGKGSDATPVGTDMKQNDFKAVQGAGETRIAAAAGVPPVIVGLSEGLQASTYSNYAQARRRFADGTMRPLWRNIAGSLASIIDVPARAELWYDARDISFLQEDEKDAAEIQSTEASTIRTLIESGYTPESVVQAVTSGDFSKLDHTGLYSVQLQEPGAGTETDPLNPAPTVPALNGANGRRLLEQYVANS